MTLRRHALVLLLSSLLALAGCATGPSRAGAGVRTEKQVVQALTAIGASDEQRHGVLAAYDAALPQLRVLQAERSSLQAQLQALSPKQPGYATEVQALAQRWGDLHRREVESFASFETAVAAVLNDDQWPRWRDYSGEPAYGPRERRQPR